VVAFTLLNTQQFTNQKLTFIKFKFQNSIKKLAFKNLPKSALRFKKNKKVKTLPKSLLLF
jgi:hypothetical protein